MNNDALPKLLRAIASGSDARAAGQDIILNAAADELERLAEIIQKLNNLSIRTHTN